VVLQLQGWVEAGHPFCSRSQLNWSPQGCPSPPRAVGSGSTKPQLPSGFWRWGRTPSAHIFQIFRGREEVMGVAGAQSLPLGVLQSSSCSASSPGHPPCSARPCPRGQHSGVAAAPGSPSQPCSRLSAQQLSHKRGSSTRKRSARSGQRERRSECSSSAQLPLPCSEAEGIYDARSFCAPGAIPPAGRAALTIPSPASVRPSSPSVCGSRPGRGCCEWGGLGAAN